MPNLECVFSHSRVDEDEMKGATTKPVRIHIQYVCLPYECGNILLHSGVDTRCVLLGYLTPCFHTAGTILTLASKGHEEHKPGAILGPCWAKGKRGGQFNTENPVVPNGMPRRKHARALQ